jgi:hypothetical protein
MSRRQRKTVYWETLVDLMNEVIFNYHQSRAPSFLKMLDTACQIAMKVVLVVRFVEKVLVDESDKPFLIPKLH